MIKKLLNEYQDYQGQYGNKLTNHLPMVVLALDELGVEEEKIIRFAKQYVMDKEVTKLAETSIVIDKDNWKEYLGQHRYENEYRHFFELELDRLKLKAFIDQYLNVLIEGMAAAAFHGIIRLSYALRSKIESEIIHAFAYFAISYLEVPEFKSLNIADPFEQMSLLSRNTHFKEKHFKGKNITERIVEVALDPVSVNLLSEIQIDSDVSNQIKNLAIDLFARSFNFTVLHIVTGTHAFFTLLPYCKEQEKLIKTFWITLQLAYLSTNCVALDELDDQEFEFNESEIISQISTSDNAHLIKIVHSILSEYQNNKNKLYPFAALKMVEDGFR